jgi:hypothetical protein
MVRAGKTSFGGFAEKWRQRGNHSFSSGRRRADRQASGTMMASTCSRTALWWAASSRPRPRRLARHGCGTLAFGTTRTGRTPRDMRQHARPLCAHSRRAGERRDRRLYCTPADALLFYGINHRIHRNAAHRLRRLAQSHDYTLLQGEGGHRRRSCRSLRAPCEVCLAAAASPGLD